MASKKNIIVGAASVYLGPSWDGPGSGQANPAPAVSGTTSYRSTLAGSAPWRDVGYTQDGVDIATDPSFQDVEVDQLLDAAKIFKDSMGLTISTSMVEATLENLLIAWGQANSTLTSTATEKTLEIDGGALGDAPLERGLIAVGNAPEKSGSNSYGERTYHAYRVLSVEGVSTQMSRSEVASIPVSFRCLPADNGRYGIVRDRMNIA